MRPLVRARKWRVCLDLVFEIKRRVQNHGSGVACADAAHEIADVAVDGERRGGDDDRRLVEHLFRQQGGHVDGNAVEGDVVLLPSKDFHPIDEILPRHREEDVEGHVLFFDGVFQAFQFGFHGGVLFVVGEGGERFFELGEGGGEIVFNMVGHEIAERILVLRLHPVEQGGEEQRGAAACVRDEFARFGEAFRREKAGLPFIGIETAKNPPDGERVRADSKMVGGCVFQRVTFVDDQSGKIRQKFFAFTGFRIRTGGDAGVRRERGEEEGVVRDDDARLADAAACGHEEAGGEEGALAVEAVAAFAADGVPQLGGDGTVHVRMVAGLGLFGP